MSAAPYGLVGVFAEPEPLIAAAVELREKGFSSLDAFTPFPVEELDEPLRVRAGVLPWIVLIGGLLGAVAAYALILYSVEIDYPIDVAGRPLNAWPPYLLLAFEGGILGAALAGFFGMLALNRLPTYYHPIFNAPSFTFAKGDRFYLVVRRDDPRFRPASIREVLSAHKAVAIEEVEL